MQVFKTIQTRLPGCPLIAADAYGEGNGWREERCESCWVLNEFDYCSGSKPGIGCFSPAASR
jgi:hypothetical protein